MLISVQIWTVSNYQWNLKWAYQSATKFAFSWHPEKVNIFPGLFFYLKFFRPIVSISSTEIVFSKSSSLTDTRRAARTPSWLELVISAFSFKFWRLKFSDKICLTDFSKTIIPPPMSNYELELGRPAHNMAYNGCDLAVYDSGTSYQTCENIYLSCIWSLSLFQGPNLRKEFLKNNLKKKPTALKSSVWSRIWSPISAGSTTTPSTVFRWEKVVPERVSPSVWSTWIRKCQNSRN